MPKLKVMMPETGEVTHELADETITLGRIADNVIQIEDGSVSSRHAQLTLLEGGSYQLQDLGSTNGTRVNGAPATDVVLKHGDRVRFGQIEAAFYADSAPATAEPMPAPAEPVAKPAAETHRPSNFTNASPFQKKSKQKDPAGLYFMLFAGIAVLALVVAVVLVLGLQAPTLPPAP